MNIQKNSFVAVIVVFVLLKKMYHLPFRSLPPLNCTADTVKAQSPSGVLAAASCCPVGPLPWSSTSVDQEWTKHFSFLALCSPQDLHIFRKVLCQ